jgi:hypothetical protein
VSQAQFGSCWHRVAGLRRFFEEEDGHLVLGVCCCIFRIRISQPQTVRLSMFRFPLVQSGSPRFRPVLPPVQTILQTVQVFYRPFSPVQAGLQLVQVSFSTFLLVHFGSPWFRPILLIQSGSGHFLTTFVLPVFIWELV